MLDLLLKFKLIHLLYIKGLFMPGHLLLIVLSLGISICIVLPAMESKLLDFHLYLKALLLLSLCESQFLSILYLPLLSASIRMLI